MKPPFHRTRFQQQQSEDVHHAHKVLMEREFESVEEMLRDDAAHTKLPPSVVHRLKKSVAQEIKPSRPWWKMFFPKG